MRRTTHRPPVPAPSPACTTLAGAPHHCTPPPSACHLSALPLDKDGDRTWRWDGWADLCCVLWTPPGLGLSGQAWMGTQLSAGRTLAAAVFVALPCLSCRAGRGHLPLRALTWTGRSPACSAAFTSWAGRAFAEFVDLSHGRSTPLQSREHNATTRLTTAPLYRRAFARRRPKTLS